MHEIHLSNLLITNFVLQGCRNDQAYNSSNFLEIALKFSLSGGFQYFETTWRKILAHCRGGLMPCNLQSENPIAQKIKEL